MFKSIISPHHLFNSKIISIFYSHIATPLFLLLVLLSSIFLFTTITAFGMLQFSGMDGGVLTNVAYQLFLGYKPYSDTITGVPPLFLIGAKSAITLFGLRWYSFVIFTALFAVLAYLFHIFLLNQLRVGHIWSIIIAFATQSIVLVPISFWWYNQITTIAAILFSCSSLFLYKSPRNSWAQHSFVFTMVLLALAKPNIAGILLPFTVLIFLLTKIRGGVMRLTIKALLIFLVVLILFQISIIDLVRNYLMASGRAFSHEIWDKNLWVLEPWEVQRTFSIVAPSIVVAANALVLMLVNNEIRKRAIPYIFLIVLSFFTGYIAMGTNNEFNSSDAMLMLQSAMLFIFFWKQIARQRWKPFVRLSEAILMLSLIGMTVNGFQMGKARDRVRSSGPAYFYFNTDKPSLIENPSYFKGLTAPMEFVGVLMQLQQIISQLNIIGPLSTSPIFFGPRLDFAYAMFGIHPPKGLPLWWEPFTFRTHNKQRNANRSDMINRFKRADVKIAIFVDYPFYPKEIADYLAIDFTQHHIGSFFVHIKRDVSSLESFRQIVEDWENDQQSQ